MWTGGASASAGGFWWLLTSRGWAPGGDDAETLPSALPPPWLIEAKARPREGGAGPPGRQPRERGAGGCASEEEKALVEQEDAPSGGKETLRVQELPFPAVALGTEARGRAGGL